MAGSRRAGPQDAWNDSVGIEDGTLCRAASSLPGPIGIATENVRRDGTLAGVGLTGTARKISDRILHLSLAAIRRETGCGVGESLRDQIPELVRILSDVQTALVPYSATVGSPRSRPNGGLGDVLAALDLNFLQESIGPGSGEFLCELTMGNAQTVATRRNVRIDGESDAITEQLARSVALLTRLILQGIVDYGTRSSRGAGTLNAKGVGDVTPLVAKLRSSKLGGAFATWIANNWTELLGNPRLRSGPRFVGAATSAPERVVTQRRPLGSPSPANTSASEAPTFSLDINMAAQAATLVSAAAQGTPFCPT